MKHIKLSSKNKKELKNLIQTLWIYSQDIGTESDRKKCIMLVMKSGKWHITKGVELPNQAVIGTLGEKETYKYLRILEGDTIKQREMKENIKKEYLRRSRNLLKIKLYCKKLLKGINTWTVLLIRHSGPFLKRTIGDLNKWTRVQEN